MVYLKMNLGFKLVIGHGSKAIFHQICIYNIVQLKLYYLKVVKRKINYSTSSDNAFVIRLNPDNRFESQLH